MRIEKIRALGGLSPYLPKGGVNRIAAKLDKSHTTVSLILSGKWWDEEVIAEALNLIEVDATAKQRFVEEFKAAAVEATPSV